MGIYLIAFVIMLIINIEYVNRKTKYLNDMKPFRTELVEAKQEAINTTRELLQNIECEKCFNKNKTKKYCFGGIGYITTTGFEKCKYATTNNDCICLAKDKQYFIDKLNIEQKDEREAVLGNEA